MQLSGLRWVWVSGGETLCHGTRLYSQQYSPGSFSRQRLPGMPLLKFRFASGPPPLPEQLNARGSNLAGKSRAFPSRRYSSVELLHSRRASKLRRSAQTHRSHATEAATDPADPSAGTAGDRSHNHTRTAGCYPVLSGGRNGGHTGGGHVGGGHGGPCGEMSVPRNSVPPHSSNSQQDDETPPNGTAKPD